ncbi:sulfite exporter TauE/SafE family protein [Bosea sp. (in: a-proteobacteria)]|uniref:sulfite exporter TauE/SafE family protein n=1 Tax=Bosea sp. (in: a-proteobacteria) TaxID=1871050 RepID=UPI0026231202|nr:sulfite exporter TauE/SafE family protein [Bosea sp. (in: a-proteobacteria)]MCO5089982.1 sulfite exporter TauE/SafE family protein [Bosea sp. (in: a-proteobacteria)]
MESNIVLVVAGLAAGALNAVAGGGTFLSFPALVWIGVPPITANATATLAALPGYVGSAWGFRKDIRAGGPIGMGWTIAMAALGGLLGALLLLVTPKETFSALVPWLLLGATVVFAAGPALVQRVLRQGGGLPMLPALLLLLAVSIYGGYFNGGLGIMLLAAFGFVGLTDLHEMNGLKSLMSAVLSTVSVATYAAAGLIEWRSALVLGVSCALGGFIGAQLARRITNMLALRIFITLVGLGMAAAFFLA